MTNALLGNKILYRFSWGYLLLSPFPGPYTPPASLFTPPAINHYSCSHYRKGNNKRYNETVCLAEASLEPRLELEVYTFFLTMTESCFLI